MNRKCKYCTKVFNGLTEYQLNEKLKRHTKDKHETLKGSILTIDGIPKAIFDILQEVNQPIRYRKRIPIGSI